MITSAPFAAGAAQSARNIENFWITEATIKPRGGTVHRVTISGVAEFLFSYQGNATDEYFVANATDIFEFSDATPDGTTLTVASVTGQTNADYSVLETTTDAGSFLHLVNGTDNLQYYDGTVWTEITQVSTPAITGIDSNKFSHVWAHNSRVWFIEKDTLNAWYLGTNSVSGAATKFSLAGVFNKGGKLLFGATWSSDSGDGLDDRWVVGTDEGEIAIYVGTNPASVNTWSLQGVYDVGKVVSKNAHVNIGGDLVAGTTAGFIPLSGIVSKDPTQTNIDSLVRNIAEDYTDQVAFAGNNDDWHFVKWEEQNAIMIAPPIGSGGENKVMVANMVPGAYSCFTGWNVESMAVLGGNLHYGDNGGKVYQAEQGGYDDGNIFECRAVLTFDTLGAPANLKIAHAIRGIWRFNTPIEPRHSIAVDYQLTYDATPNVAMQAQGSGSPWDTSPWDTSSWGASSGSNQILKDWENARGQGVALAPVLQLTSGQSYKLDCELVQVSVLYEIGAAI